MNSGLWTKDNGSIYKDFISSCIIPTFLAGAHSVPGLFIFFLSYSPRDENALYNEGDRIGDMLWRS